MSYCCAQRCYSRRPDVSMHRFPNDKERLKEWLVRSGRNDLLKMDIDVVYERRRSLWLCSRHFEDSQFNNPTHTRLMRCAMPTLFSDPNLPSHIKLSKPFPMPPPLQFDATTIKQEPVDDAENIIDQVTNEVEVESSVEEPTSTTGSQQAEATSLQTSSETCIINSVVSLNPAQQAKKRKAVRFLAPVLLNLNQAGSRLSMASKFGEICADSSGLVKVYVPVKLPGSGNDGSKSSTPPDVSSLASKAATLIRPPVGEKQQPFLYPGARPQSESAVVPNSNCGTQPSIPSSLNYSLLKTNVTPWRKEKRVPTPREQLLQKNLCAKRVQISRLKRKVQKLQEILECAEVKLKYNKNNFQTITERIQELGYVPERCIEFMRSQMYAYSCKTARYPHMIKVFALKMYHKNHQLYFYLKKTFALPTTRSLMRWTRLLEKMPNFDKKLFDDEDLLSSQLKQVLAEEAEKAQNKTSDSSINNAGNGTVSQTSCILLLESLTRPTKETAGQQSENLPSTMNINKTVSAVHTQHLDQPNEVQCKIVSTISSSDS